MISLARKFAPSELSVPSVHELSREQRDCYSSFAETIGKGLTEFNRMVGLHVQYLKDSPSPDEYNELKKTNTDLKKEIELVTQKAESEQTNLKEKLFKAQSQCDAVNRLQDAAVRAAVREERAKYHSALREMKEYIDFLNMKTKDLISYTGYRENIELLQEIIDKKNSPDGFNFEYELSACTAYKSELLEEIKSTDRAPPNWSEVDKLLSSPLSVIALQQNTIVEEKEDAPTDPGHDTLMATDDHPLQDKAAPFDEFGSNKDLVCGEKINDLMVTDKPANPST